MKSEYSSDISPLNGKGQLYEIAPKFQSYAQVTPNGDPLGWALPLQDSVEPVADPFLGGSIFGNEFRLQMPRG